MPYIGNTAADKFVAAKAATQFSGDGSATAFTLDHAVGSDEDILVSVDGVIQEPSVAYAVSSGTTLTFTAAPSSNSGNNIFVYYLFRTIGTIGHPSNNALTATSGTFTGAIAFDTLQTSGQISGTTRSVDTEHIVKGSAKFLVTYTTVTTTATTNSFNFSSLSDIGTGVTDLFFTNNFSADKQYIVTATSTTTSDFTASAYTTTPAIDSIILTNKVRVRGKVANNGGSVFSFDFSYNCVECTGDLA